MHAEVKRTHVEAWQISRLTKAAYARQHNINSKTLSRWCRDYPHESVNQLGLAAVSIQDAVSSPNQTAITLQLRSGCVLDVPVDISPRWLGKLLQCLD